MDEVLAEEQTQPSTQGHLDPRRMGRNNSGLSEADISDVMCILHPCSPAAFGVVAQTAAHNPQNVLHNNGYRDYNDGLTRSALEEQETFILRTEANTPAQATDLALRFGAHVVNPALGFVFGRNPKICDIVLTSDVYKRVSNMHFAIFMNESGVLMLQDFSTNGTMVDHAILRGKQMHAPQTRMLEPGSIIQILSPMPEEVVKFIVRIPSREGHFDAYERKFQQYIYRQEAAEIEHAKQDAGVRRLMTAQAKTQSSHKVTLVKNQFGMHWSGGEKYNVVGLIGKGAFATVYQLATKSEGKLFAAKELEKRKFVKAGAMDRKLENEMKIMKAISHPNIVQYVDYQDIEHHLYIIMEYVPCGDMQQCLLQYGPLDEDIAKKMAAQVLDSLSYLHKKKITHRDIKPDNILIADMQPDTFTVKLSDFGLSKVVNENETFLKTFCGTLLYCAPEVFPHYDGHVAGRGQKRNRISANQQFHSYSQTVDIWSFGAVLWFCLCLKPPFEGVADNTGRGMFEKIMMTPLDPIDLLKQGVSAVAVALLTEMLNIDPTARPPPAYCLRHPWFGHSHSVGSPEQGLRAIAEEEENEYGAAPNVAGLSLCENQEAAQRNESQDSYFDDASIHSGSMDFFDPRQPKRLKSSVLAYRSQGELVESSPELFHQSIEIDHQPESGTTHQQTTAPRPKLFGEISQSALNQGALNAQASHAAAASQSAWQSQAGAGAHPSLQGAESMMRDVHMDSPHSSCSGSGSAAEPTTPATPEAKPVQTPAKGTPNSPADATPRPQQRRTFNRQICVPFSASFFHEADDPSTHNVEYASRVSGHDFAKEPSLLVSGNISLPTTTAPSGSTTEDDHHDDTDPELEAPGLEPLMASPKAFVKPPPRLAKLTTTVDSFMPITLNISSQHSVWGRDPYNTHTYPDKLDTRVPKRGIILVFDSPARSQHEEDADLTKVPNLYCAVTTESRSGIWVNGVHLAPENPRNGGKNFGRLYTGDEITVFRADRGGKGGLKFVCEFFHGLCKETRPGYEPFKVMTTFPNRTATADKKSGNAEKDV
ncbi:hypothetical protein EJ03DRAFT_125829 [Teratosphaeria nubilosa]|uniref:Pkinase-domain-containing protein n=1 Tax=Teratosphaeria nubilosa TaxID=161662 RepID=A0A6G1LLL1_9PEZI|nr:hypothetical protein EJ03DRAFT_125829 [Teratosphaeria nubilosa]